MTSNINTKSVTLTAAPGLASLVAALQGKQGTSVVVVDKGPTLSPGSLQLGQHPSVTDRKLAKKSSK